MTKDDKETVRKLEEGFLMGLSDREACKYANCSHDWLYSYCKKHKGYSDRKELLKSQPTIKAKMVINEHLDLGDKQTAQWYLERKAKEEFGTKSTLEHSGSTKTEIVVSSEKDKKALEDDYS